MPTLKFSGYIATNNTAPAAAGSYTETELTGCDLCPGPTLFRAPLLNNASLQTFPHKLDPLVGFGRAALHARRADRHAGNSEANGLGLLSK